MPAFNKAENTGLRHLVNATRFSLHGLKSAFLNESAFRQELVMSVVVLGTAAYVHASLLELIALFCLCLFVLTVELINSGIEAVIDRIGTEHHDMSKVAKDYGSAAVMMALMITGIAWATVILGNIVES
ncbi:MAG: diacylglycerol kinase [Gammaproteobacteria bacterium]|nr:diacylglycerol kinase [Gammaproteobacteria bacterium]